MCRAYRVVVVSIMALVVLTSCSTPLDDARRNGFNPEKGPRHGCYIYCSQGRKPIFQRQHICPGGTRWFEDIFVTGETKDAYLTKEGSYDKLDVELVPCNIYVKQIIDSRPAEQRGKNPGEDNQGNPQPPL
jgi:hypothetical protein